MRLGPKRRQTSGAYLIASSLVARSLTSWKNRVAETPNRWRIASSCEPRARHHWRQKSSIARSRSVSSSTPDTVRGGCDKNAGGSTVGCVRDTAVPVLDLAREGLVWLLARDGTATPAPNAERAHGLGLPWPEPFSAVYVDGDTVRLRVGHRTWDVATIVRVRQLEDGPVRAVYALELTNGTAEPVVIAFPPDVRAARLTDPTHDEIASWTEDVMKVLPYTARDGWSSSGETVAEFAARVLPLWREGARVRGR